MNARSTFRYPDVVRRAIMLRFRDSLQPLCIEVDRDWQVLSVLGNKKPDTLGCRVGDDLLAQYPVACGLKTEQAITLPKLQIDRGIVIDLELIPTEQGAWVLIYDVSSTHAEQVEIQEQQNEIRLLEYRIGQLKSELISAREQAETASQLKSQFIAGMSHEFRTPLTSILGYAELLDKDQSGSNPYLLGITKSSNHLLSLVDNLLEHGRVVSDSIEARREVINLPNLFDSLRLMFEPLAAQENLHFEVQCQNCSFEDVYSDNVRLRQIIVNLITNAIRYTEKGWIKLVWQQKSNKLQVQVIDSGPGITDKDQQRIFSAFTQLSASAGSQGLGLGLSISRHLTELLGGQLELSSEIGKGSTFTVTVQAEPSIEAAPARVSSNEQASVLIIEDDQDVLEYIKTFLMDDFVVHAASRLVDALKLLSDESIDVILSDLNLSDASGDSVVRTLRRAEPSIPIIVMSASNLETDRQQAEQNGCSEFFIKPFDMSQLIKSLKRHAGAA